MDLPKSCLNQKFNSHILLIYVHLRPHLLAKIFKLASDKGDIGKVKIEKENFFFFFYVGRESKKIFNCFD